MPDRNAATVFVRGYLQDCTTKEFIYDNHFTSDGAFLAQNNEDVDLFLARSRTGRGFVGIAIELGDSVQIPNGHWLSGKAMAEVRVPCHLTHEDYSKAGSLATSFARSLAETELENIRATVQAEIDKS